ncbi:MAG: hypothetical protein MJ053_06160 [Elusimicrobiaceae bacterium]|nr:hypothetical protein [Elusimicrobiaceae bacterium]
MKRLVTTVYVLAATVVFLPVCTSAAPSQQTAQLSLEAQVEAAALRARRNLLPRKLAAYERQLAREMKRHTDAEVQKFFVREIMPKLKETVEQEAPNHEGMNFQPKQSVGRSLPQDPETTSLLAVVVWEGEFPNLVRCLLAQYADARAYHKGYQATIEQVARIKHGLESQVVELLHSSATARNNYEERMFDIKG